MLASQVSDLGTLVGDSRATDVDGDLASGYAYDGRDRIRAVAWHLDTGTLVSLGTFGGPNSVAEAVDGTLVVGSADTSSGETHAFAYDFADPSPHLIDLGTFGGSTSVATDEADGVIVGESMLPDGAERAFAVDLNAASPHMVSIGSPGLVIRPAAVDHGVVVGQFYPTGAGSTRAFLYNLNAANPHIVDLGTFGGEDSEATDVTGNLVVGYARTAGGARHAFVYDLAAASPALHDLSENHPRQGSVALATDGTTVVGERTDNRGAHAFSYDTAAVSPTMRDLGTLGGAVSEAVDIDGGIAVGTAQLADSRSHAFAYDTADPSAEMTDLGTLGRGTYSAATAVSGDRVVGDLPVGETTVHAAAWTLLGRAAQAFEFPELESTVSEAAGTMKVTVDRVGSTTGVATVQYATGPITARRGLDFVDTRGMLTFGPGQTQKTVSIPIVDDDTLERPEVLAVRLTEPSSTAVLGTPSTRTVTIEASDQRPDAWISARRALRGFIGNDRYADLGDVQVKHLAVARGKTGSFYVRVFNDGNVPNTFTLTALPVAAGTRVRYFIAGDDVTAALRSTAGVRVNLRPARWVDVYRPPRTVLVEARVTVRSGAAVGSTHSAVLRATWSGDSRRWDAVRGAVRVVR